MALAAAAVVCAWLSLGASPAHASLAQCYQQTITITGTDGDDKGVNAIQGTSGNDVISAEGGDDEIHGNGGNDIICAGDGDDTVDTLGGTDAVGGGDGDDNISTGSGDDYFIDGGRDTDTCDAGPGENGQVVGCTSPTKFLVGQSAPDLLARTAFDNKFQLSGLEGQNVMIDFSTLWCPPSLQMLSEMANIQAAARAQGIKFTYVLAELQDQSFSNTDRHDAEVTLERWDLYDSPVLHTAGLGESSKVFGSFANFVAENIPVDQSTGQVQAFPTQVFVNKRGKVTEIHQGLLNSEELLDRYGDFSDVPDKTLASAPLPGDDIENIEDQVQAQAGVSSGDKKDLKKVLQGGLHALEKRLGPSKSPCAYLSKFRRMLKDVKHLNPTARQALTSSALDVESEIGCG